MLCRLCCEECLDFEDLYDNDDQENYIYQICQKFFFRELEKLGKTLDRCSKIICDACWKTINEFNDFYEKIVAQQTEYCNLIAGRMSMNLPEISDCYIVEDVDGVKSEIIVNNKVLRKSSVKRSKGCDLKDVFDITDTFMTEASLQNDSARDCSEMNDFNDYVKVKIEEGFVDEGEDNELEEDDGTSQSYSSSFLADYDAENSDIEINHLKKESNRSGFNMLQDKRLEEIEYDIRNGQWEVELRCDVCEFSCTRNSVFVNHYKEKHPDNLNSQKLQKPFECEFCHIGFSLKSYLRRHLITHTKTTENHECTQCGKRFVCRNYLTRHIKTMHIETRWTCDLCGTKLGSKHGLLYHKERNVCKKVMGGKSKHLEKVNEKLDCIENSEESPVAFSESSRTNESLFEKKPEEPSGQNEAHILTEQCIQPNKLDSGNYGSHKKQETQLTVNASNESFLQTKDGNNFERVKRDFVMNNKDRGESSNNRSESKDFERNSHKIDTFTKISNFPYDSEKYSSEMNSLNNTLEIKVKEELIYDSEENELSEDADTNQSFSNSLLGEYAADDNSYKDYKLLDKTIQKIKSDILKGKWNVMLRCDLCEYSSVKPHMYMIHYKNAHPDNLHSPKFQKPFECELCHKLFSQKVNLKTHYSTHIEGLQDFQCSECDKRFSCEEYLFKHITNKHEKDKKWICDLCGVQVSTKQSLIYHKERKRCKSRRLI